VQIANAVTVIVTPPPRFDSAVAIAVHTVALDGYEDVSTTRSLLFADEIVTWAPPPSNSFVAAQVAVDVICVP
jgi:hypothetical protein